MENKTTSFESSQGGVFGDILNAPRQERPSLRVGLIGCGYFEYWRMYPHLKKRVEDDLVQVYTRLDRELDVVYPGMVDTLDAAEVAGRALAEARVDVVIVVEGTYLPDFMVLNALEHVPHARIILFSTQSGEDVSSDDEYEDTMRNSALIGIAQLSGTFAKSRRRYDVVVGEISEPACYERIVKLVRSQEIAARLRTRTYGLVGHVFRGMFDLEFDRGGVRGCLGPEVMSVQAENLVEVWKEIPDEEVARAAGELTSRYKMRIVTDDDVKRSVRLGLAMRRLVEKFRLDGLCFLGQHYIEKMTRAPARLGASMRVEQDRVMVSCEGDVGGLIMMEIMHDLSGRPPVQMEWGQFHSRQNALFLLGHGIASPEIAAAADKVTLTRSPEEWGFEGNGANWEMILAPGPVTMGHFLATADGWRMLISKGEAIEFPCLPCDEIHGLVRVESPVRQYLQNIIEYGITHHVIVVHGDVFEELQMVADAMGVDTLIAL